MPANYCEICEQEKDDVTVIEHPTGNYEEPPERVAVCADCRNDE